MTNENHALNQAAAHMESIAQMVAALSVDYERLAELRELAKARRYVAGWNMPGYMPDCEPQCFDDIDDARAYIADAMREEAEELIYLADAQSGSEEAETRYIASGLMEAADALDSLTTAGPAADYGRTIGRFHYFVACDGFMIDEDPKQREELETLESEAGDSESEEEARETLQEDPLSVEYRSGWSTDPREPEPEEFCVLLCTGGPAVRIVGELGERGSIHRARMEYQDWFTPWTHYDDADSATLVAYCESLGVGEF